MFKLTINEISAATKAKSNFSNSNLSINGVSIDSRTIKKGNLFVAIKGERLNGHKFIKAALAKGAKALVVSDKKYISRDTPTLVVKDTTKALGQIASIHRRKFKIPIIAITGSAGKTTTKDMIASVLCTKYKVLKNLKTENNQYGVPLTLLKLNKSYQIAVIELGTNRNGDIDWLGKITEPTTAVFTNIGESHLEGLKNKRGVFNEKVKLLRHVSSNGNAILNNDDKFLRTLSKKNLGFRKISFGIINKAGLKAYGTERISYNKIKFKIKNRIFILNSPSIHNVYNALASICCGLDNKATYYNISKKLKSYKFSNSRQDFKKVGNIYLIDDTYNSNPVSFRSAIDTLDSLPLKGKKILVCGDMLELGEKSKQLHELMGKRIAKSSINYVLGLGRLSRHLVEKVNNINNNITTHHYNKIDDINLLLKTICNAGDIILVKGSRMMKMERIVDSIKKHFK